MFTVYGYLIRRMENQLHIIIVIIIYLHEIKYH